VFTARCSLSPCVKQTQFVFRGLICSCRLRVMYSLFFAMAYFLRYSTNFDFTLNVQRAHNGPTQTKVKFAAQRLV